MAPERISRIHVESITRRDGFVMASYHCHFFYELYFLEKGSCRFFIDNSFHDLQTGDFILIPPQMLHYTRYMFGDCRRTVIFFRQDDIEGLSGLMNRADFFSTPRIVQVAPVYRERITSLLEQMLTEERISDDFSSSILELRLREFFLLCIRYGTILEDTPDIYTTDRQILLAVRFMSEHFREKITSEEIAAAAGFTPSYLSRRFRECAGIGVHQYLTFLRLQQARMELLSTTDSITDIALRCGFASSNYFKDAFQKQYGTSPRDYRKSRDGQLTTVSEIQV